MNKSGVWENRMKVKSLVAGSAMLLALQVSSASAKPSAEELAELGASLTPFGAEAAGNADGTIPAWDGGLTNPPATDGTVFEDPYAADKVLFEINAGNLGEYKDKLSPGQVALLEKYPTHKMRVFPSRRSVTYPEEIFAAVKENAGKVELLNNGYGTTPYKLSHPFPVLSGNETEKGMQAIWNHLTRWRGGTITRTVSQVTPLANGDFSPVTFREDIGFLDSLKDAEEARKKDANIIFYFKQEITAPSRLAGNVLLAHETLDQVTEPRRAWIYNSGQRRVRRAPQVAYDGPGTASDGLRTTDNFDMFNGAPDRYDWKYVGKQEMYIPYNNYPLLDRDLRYSDIVRPGHLNPDLLRYELHRVHVVEATLKEGQRHIYAKRVFFLDEDTWQATVVDHYDGRGQMWRVAEAYNVLYYNVNVPWYAADSLYDLLSGRYLTNSLTNEENEPYQFGVDLEVKEFTPAALRRAGRK